MKPIFFWHSRLSQTNEPFIAPKTNQDGFGDDNPFVFPMRFFAASDDSGLYALSLFGARLAFADLVAGLGEMFESCSNMFSKKSYIENPRKKHRILWFF